MRRHVLEPHERPVGIGAQDHHTELLGRHEPSLGADRVGELHAGRRRLGAHLARRVHGVLLLDGGRDLGDGDVQGRQPVGPHPDAHGILARAEDRDAGDAGYARELVVDVDVGVVGQERGVIGPLGRIERDDHEGR